MLKTSIIIRQTPTAGIWIVLDGLTVLHRGSLQACIAFVEAME